MNGALAADTRIPVTLPQIYTLAVALWPVRDRDHEWKIEFDVDYVGWKSFRSLDVHLSTGGTLFTYATMFARSCSFRFTNSCDGMNSAG